jgi:hypothetical protein
MYERLICSAADSSARVPYSPLSSIRCQRCARARALTSARSNFGGGAQSSQPGGATMTFRPPRRRHAAALRSSAAHSRHRIF